MIEVRIAIYTTILTGMICSNVYTGNATAGNTLILVLSYIELIHSDPLKTITVYATGVSNPKFTQVDFFCTGVNINVVFFGNFAEATCDFFRLSGSQSVNAKRSNPALDILV